MKEPNSRSSLRAKSKDPYHSVYTSLLFSVYQIIEKQKEVIYAKLATNNPHICIQNTRRMVNVKMLSLKLPQSQFNLQSQAQSIRSLCDNEYYSSNKCKVYSSIGIDYIPYILSGNGLDS